jgi:hypothetical protein
MRELLGREIPDTAPYTEWLAIVGSIVVAVLVCAVLFSNGVPPTRGESKAMRQLALDRDTTALALSALHAGENGGGHVVQKQSTREG